MNNIPAESSQSRVAYEPIAAPVVTVAAPTTANIEEDIVSTNSSKAGEKKESDSGKEKEEKEEK